MTQAQSLKVASIFTDRAVLQHSSNVKIWGTSKPSAQIEVNTSWGVVANNISSSAGEWEVTVKTPKAGYKSYSIIITSENERIMLSDIVCGEVWLLSGQSNMEMSFYENPLNSIRVDGASEVLAGADDCFLRSFNVARSEKFYPQPDITPNGGWKFKNRNDVVWFSAVGYFFAAKLRAALNVPVGIINSSYGGTPIESWIPEGFSNNVIFDSKRVERSDEIRLNSLGNEAAIQRFSDWITKSQKSEGDALAAKMDDNLSILELPNYFYNTPRGESLGGTMLYKTINIAQPVELELNLPQIDRNCQIFFNGVLVHQEILPSQAYRHPKVKIAADLVKKGENLLSINMITTLWNGGIVGAAEEMFIKSADSVISLAGKWSFKKTFELSQTSPVPQEGLPNAFLLSSLYNGMIDPLKRFTVKGVLWYQGEANISNSQQYPLMLSSLVQGWRNAWGVNLPFYYVQIAPWSYSGHSNTEAAHMRSIMSDSCKSIANSAVVLTGDLGDSLNIHPPKKREVGERLALKALSKTYIIKEYGIDYPVVKSAHKEGSKVVLTIEGTYGQIIVKPGANTFEMSEDGINYFKSSFEIRGNKIILQCDKVKGPKFVRHAFSNSSKVNVLNSKMLPLNLFTLTLKN